MSNSHYSTRLSTGRTAAARKNFGTRTFSLSMCEDLLLWCVQYSVFLFLLKYVSTKIKTYYRGFFSPTNLFDDFTIDSTHSFLSVDCSAAINRQTLFRTRSRRGQMNHDIGRNLKLMNMLILSTICLYKTIKTLCTRIKRITTARKHTRVAGTNSIHSCLQRIQLHGRKIRKIFYL